MKAEGKFVNVFVREVMGAIINKAFGIKSDILLQNGPKNECDYVSPSAMK